MGIYTGVFILFRRGGTLSKIWQDSKGEVLMIAALQNLSYFSFLMALQMSKVSYTVAFRQVGAVFGAILGVVFLRESHWKMRIAGASILTLGLLLIGLAK
jgi:drug/metabolite transporter (DMT)-like permease